MSAQAYLLINGNKRYIIAIVNAILSNSKSCIILELIDDLTSGYCVNVQVSCHIDTIDIFCMIFIL